MSTPDVGDVVRLLRDFPEWLAHRGQRGVVCSVWFSPDDAYEIELEAPHSPMRILAHSSDIVVVIHDGTPDAAERNRPGVTP